MLPPYAQLPGRRNATRYINGVVFSMTIYFGKMIGNVPLFSLTYSVIHTLDLCTNNNGHSPLEPCEYAPYFDHITPHYHYVCFQFKTSDLCAQHYKCGIVLLLKKRYQLLSLKPPYFGFPTSLSFDFKCIAGQNYLNYLILSPQIGVRGQLHEILHHAKSTVLEVCNRSG